jgi:hypothetical protein
MFDPFEINFKRRLAEDPDYYNRYIRDTHSRMDKLINNILVNTSKPSKRTVVRRQPFVNSNSRATNNGQRSAKRETRIFDKANSDKLKEASRNLNDELSLTNPIDTKDFKTQKETAKHFMKTAKEYGLL